MDQYQGYEGACCLVVLVHSNEGPAAGAIGRAG